MSKQAHSGNADMDAIDAQGRALEDAADRHMARQEAENHKAKHTPTLNNAEQYIQITEVPARFGEGSARLSLSYLLKHADKVEEWFRPNGGSKYRAHFDDGVFKGVFVFAFRQRDLTPLSVYLQCASTGWPGLNVKWLEDLCAERMKTQMEVA